MVMALFIVHLSFVIVEWRGSGNDKGQMNDEQ
jgi:hypothetical protein